MDRFGSILVLVIILGFVFCGSTASLPSGDGKKAATEENNQTNTTETTGAPELNTSGELSFADEVQIIQEQMDKQPPISLPVGSTTNVSLKENPTTGYSWNVSVTTGLAIVNDSYTSGETRLAGAGGEHSWILKGTETGNQTFTAVYRRPWETPSQDDITYVQHFLVTP